MIDDIFDFSFYEHKKIIVRRVKKYKTLAQKREYHRKQMERIRKDKQVILIAKSAS